MTAERTRPTPTGPLKGIRIVDMTSVLMGPFATQILADYGADVIKIESEQGDLLRLGGAMRNPKMGALYLQSNRNKRSAVLDVKSRDGHEAVLKLCETADVFISNVRPAAMARAGLDYDTIRARNAGIVYASLVGYGQAGPYAQRPAYDDLIQGISGTPWLTGQVLGGSPQYVPLTMADKVAGLNAAHAILAALVYKGRTGEGQSIEVPMFEIMSQFVLTDHIGGYSFEPQHGPIGYNRLTSPDRRPYQTSDGYLSVLVYTDGHWKSFFDILGRPEQFRAQPVFHDHATRTRNYDTVYKLLADEMMKVTSAQWMVLLEKHDIPWAPCHSIEELVADPHLKAVGMFETIEHPTEGTLRMIAPAIKFSKTPASIYRYPPSLGEHTGEVLAECGMGPVEAHKPAAGAEEIPA